MRIVFFEVFSNPLSSKYAKIDKKVKRLEIIIFTILNKHPAF